MKRNVANQLISASLIALLDGTPVITGTTTVYLKKDTTEVGSIGTATYSTSSKCWYIDTGIAANSDGAALAFTWVNTLSVSFTLNVYPSFPQTVDNNVILAHADYGNNKLVRSTTPANTLSVDVNHLVAVPDTQKVDLNTAKTQAITCAAAITINPSVGMSSTANTAMQSQYDGTGLSGATYPSTQAQLASIANVGAATNIACSSYVLITGTQSSGTYLVTEPLDGILHIHTDTGGAIDLYYEFLTGAGVPTSVTVTSYLTGNNDNIEVHGYDWVSATWKQIGLKVGTAGATLTAQSFALFVNMVGSGANSGKVRIKFTDGAYTLTSATLAIDQIYVSFARGLEGYESGAIWINTAASNTNTIPGMDGTSGNPVSTIAAAMTLSVLTGHTRFEICNLSTITLAATSNGYLFNSSGASINLGSQSISSSTFSGFEISGASTGTGNIYFDNCQLDTCTLPPCVILNHTRINATVSLLAGDYFISTCLGNNSCKLDFGEAVGSTNAYLSPFYGYVEILNLGKSGTDFIAVTGHCHVILNANCVGGTIHLHGNIAFTDNSGGTVTVVNYNNASESTVLAILEDTAEIGTDGAGLTAVTGVTLAASQHVIVDSGTITTYTGNIPQTGDSFDRIGIAGAGLSAINLPDQTMDITGSLSGSVGSVTTKTGYILDATGLDSISMVSATGPATNFREMLVQIWRRFFKKVDKTPTAIITYADNGTTVITTQTISDDGVGNQTQGPAS